MANAYNLGDDVLLTGTWRVRDDDGNLVYTDPTTVKFIALAPSGSETTRTYPHASIEKLEDGQYRFRHTLDESGTWEFRAVGTGAAAGSKETALVVKSTNFSNQ